MGSVLLVIQGLSAFLQAAAPMAVALAIKDPVARQEAQAGVTLFTGLVDGLVRQYPAIAQGLRDPSTITLDALFDEDALAVLARLKASAAAGVSPAKP